MLFLNLIFIFLCIFSSTIFPLCFLFPCVFPQIFQKPNINLYESCPYPRGEKWKKREKITEKNKSKGSFFIKYAILLLSAGQKPEDARTHFPEFNSMMEYHPQKIQNIQFSNSTFAWNMH